MALPAWPIDTFSPQQDSFSGVKRMLDPIETEMEGGNVRVRARPGDNVGTLNQTIRVPVAEHDVLVAWIKNTIGNGTARFTMDVWLGSSFANKVCQFNKGGGGMNYSYVGVDYVDVSMSLRVFDV